MGCPQCGSLAKKTFLGIAACGECDYPMVQLAWPDPMAE